MPVRIRLSRGGAKKRPFYRIVVADSRRARDGKFIDQIGTYNPMLPKDSADRVKMDLDKAKEWIAKGAKPSDRISIFLSNLGVMEKPVITEKTKKILQISISHCVFFFTLHWSHWGCHVRVDNGK